MSTIPSHVWPSGTFAALKGLASAHPFSSLCAMPPRLIMAMRPARDSLTFFIKWNCWDPESQNRPQRFGFSSIIAFMCGSSCGAYWISSIMTGAGYAFRKASGSRLARSLTGSASSETKRRPASAVSRRSVVLPTCLAPVTNTAGNSLDASRISLEANLGMIFMPHSLSFQHTET